MLQKNRFLFCRSLGSLRFTMTVDHRQHQISHWYECAKVAYPSNPMVLDTHGSRRLDCHHVAMSCESTHANLTRVCFLQLHLLSL